MGLPRNGRSANPLPDGEREKSLMQSAMQARSKLPDVGTTIFTVIGQLAAQHDALNLSQGAPNFAPDAKLIDGVAQAMRAGHNQYAPMAGIAALREALADKVETLYGVRYDPSSEVTVIASASEGLYSTISAWCIPAMK
jgi:Aspartate/tyrosine/aromatic aminotransferase